MMSHKNLYLYIQAIEMYRPKPVNRSEAADLENDYLNK